MAKPDRRVDDDADQRELHAGEEQAGDEAEQPQRAEHGEDADDDRSGADRRPLWVLRLPGFELTHGGSVPPALRRCVGGRQRAR